MIDSRTIIGAIKPRVAQVLTIAEAALPASQFTAFRKLVLDQFGRQGLESELQELIDTHQTTRNG